MTSKPDLTAKYEEERLRAHEQSQIVYLQGQIDELRRMLKDQTNKYNWAMEQNRKTEAAVAQLQSMFERHTEEVSLSVDISRRDIIALRKEIAGTLVKVEEFVTPIREMQAQIHQLGEARKQDREQIFARLDQHEEVDQKILSLQAQIKEVDERYRQLTGQLDQLREADTLALQEARRVGDELQIEKQGLRRQVIEAQQMVVDIRTPIEELNSKISNLDEIRHRIDLFADAIPGQITELTSKLVEIVADIKRVERISTERFMMNQERLEEVRRQSDERLVELQEIDEQHLRQLTSWLERIDGWLLELEQRLNRGISRLDVVQQGHIERIVELEKRETRVLDAFASVFHEQAEATRIAQIEARGNDDRAVG
jgi:chromosome segregation ATPase